MDQPRIVEVSSRKDLRLFIDLPFRLYVQDPNWVAPLRGELARLLCGKTAFSRSAEIALFLAVRATRIVGRVAAIHNRAHNDYYRDATGFFGFFESEPNDFDSTKALIARVETWLAQRGLKDLRGPTNPSMNSECGLLIEGFHRPPMIGTAYNNGGYGQLLEAAGLSRCRDLFAYSIDRASVVANQSKVDRLKTLAERLSERHPEISVRSLDMRRYLRDVERIAGVFEKARQRNWGYVPVSAPELEEEARSLKRFVDPDLVIIAEDNGQAVGACIAVPDVNVAINAAGGSLLPFGWIRMLGMARRISEIRVLAIGTLEKYRRTGVTPMLAAELLRRSWEKGYARAEASWVLEDNIASQRIIERTLEFRRDKRFRIYEKPISGSR